MKINVIRHDDRLWYLGTTVLQCDRGPGPDLRYRLALLKLVKQKKTYWNDVSGFISQLQVRYRTNKGLR
jgi:hypothetical protein